MAAKRKPSISTIPSIPKFEALASWASQFIQSKVTDVSVLKLFHRAAHPSLESLGFRWERRREGESGLGLWRKTLGPAASVEQEQTRRGATPRRLVLIPGFGDTPMSWAGPLALLSPVLWSRFDELVVLDYPGWHGFLSQEKAFDSLDTLFRATGDVLDSLKPTTLLGHSLGGWVAADYAAACGEGKRPAARPAGKTSSARGWKGPSSLILAAPAGLYGEKSELDLWRSHFERAMNEGFGAFRERLFHREPKWFKLIAKDFEAFMQREDIITFMKSTEDRHLLSDRAHQIQAETWVVWGEEDSLSPAKWAPVWQSRLGGTARVALLPGLGHSLQSEKPAVVAALLGQILMGREPVSTLPKWWKIVEK